MWMSAILALSANEWTAVGTVVTAAVALFAAAFAALQVWELRRTREDQTRPFVVVDIQPGAAWSNLLDLVIENIGTTAARDVRITFDPPLKQSHDDGNPISESALLKDGIRMLPPGRRIKAFFDPSHDRVKTDLPMRHDVTVQLNDARGRRQPDQHYTIDMAYMYGTTEIREYGLHDAAKAITEIQKSVKKWSDIHGRLKVWVRDEDRRLEYERTEYDLTGHPPTLGRAAPSDLVMTFGRNILVRAAVRRVRQWRSARRGQNGS
jgi:hypothetical protein